jgi:hypothetical protein
MIKQSILRRGFWRSVFTLALRPLWRSYLFMIKSILYNFFYLQYKAVLFPQKVKVSNVSHPLDETIPFTPSWINIYMDFSPFWIRTQAFLAETFGKAADPHIAAFTRGIGELYAYAAVVYKRCFSTTRRPFYLGKPGFIPIHVLDPHLMCIPSLHVMVVIMAYTRIRKVLGVFGAEKDYSGEIESVRGKALGITESILYVKQHSINCIAAALYAMTRYDAELFPVSEAHDFTDALFTSGGPVSPVSPVSGAAIKRHILGLYHDFIDSGGGGENWEQPLLDFLENYRPEDAPNMAEAPKSAVAP